MKRILVTLAILALLAAPVSADVLVEFLNVGQGDSILITTDASEYILIDGGEEWAGRQVVLPFLASRGITRLDVVIATHPHADHIGGLIPILEHLEVGAVWADGQVHTTKTYERFLTVILEKNIPFIEARKGMSLPVSGLDEAVILHPESLLGTDLNHNSVVFRIRHGSIVMLFAGDIERAAENILLQSGISLKAQALKVAHHGSASSTTAEFIAAVSPEVAIIMVGADNRYGHPSCEVLQRLASAKVLRTDLDGHIAISSDGNKLSVLETQGQGEQVGNKRNVATATVQDLTEVQGVGQVLAERIVAFREQNALTSIDDLQKVSGVGKVLLERIKELFYFYPVD